MSKKKSYMDIKNILSEGMLDKIFLLFKKLKGDKKKSLTRAEKKLLKDPSFAKSLKNFNKHYDDVMKSNKELRKKMGLPPSKYIK